jgi:hypothetical protein
MSNELNIPNLNINQEKNCIQKDFYNKEEDLLKYTSDIWFSKKENKDRLLSFDVSRSAEVFYLTAQISKVLIPWDIDKKKKVAVLCGIIRDGESWGVDNKFKIIMPIHDFLPERQVSFLCHQVTITVLESYIDGGKWVENYVGSEVHLADIWINEVANK